MLAKSNKRHLFGVAAGDVAGKLGMRVVDAIVDNSDDEVGVAEGSRRIQIPQRLPSVGRINQSVVPLLGEKEVARDDRVLLTGGCEIWLGVNDLWLLRERVGSVEYRVGGRPGEKQAMHVAERLEAPLRCQAMATGDRGNAAVVDVLREAGDDQIRQKGSVVLGEPNHRASGLDPRMARQLAQRIGDGFIIGTLQAQHQDAAPRKVLARADDMAADALNGISDVVLPFGALLSAPFFSSRTFSALASTPIVPGNGSNGTSTFPR